MKWLAFALAILAAPRATRAQTSICGVCHGAERVQHEASIHRDGGLGCVDCHGGDPGAIEKEAAHAADAGFLDRIARREVPERCGGCHADVARMRPFGLRTDALAAYRTSHHGQALLERGSVESATCADCHGVHDVRRVRDPLSPAHRGKVPATCARCHGDAALMARHGLAASAPEEFARSVHGERLARGDPAVPTCADCHDAHAAAPPGASEVADVCGSCHRETRERFRESPHAGAAGRRGMKPCVTCHGNHAVDRPDYGLFDAPANGDQGEGGRCLSCHDAASGEDRGAAVAIAFGKGLRDAEAKLRDAEARIAATAAEGFYVDDERDALERARRELVRVVPLTHAADLPRVEGALRRVRSWVEDAMVGSREKVREARDRRIYGTGTAFALFGVAGFLTLRRRGGRG